MPQKDDKVMPQVGTPSTETDDALARRLKRLGLTGGEDDWAERYLLCEHMVEPDAAPVRQRFEAIARFIRDLIAHRWVKTRLAREQSNPKRIYYLSMEFLIGRTEQQHHQPGGRPVRPAPCAVNTGISPRFSSRNPMRGWARRPLAGWRRALSIRWPPCISAIGYGLQYEYGIFRQSIATAIKWRSRTIGCGGPIPGRSRAWQGIPRAAQRQLRARGSRLRSFRAAVSADGVAHDRQWSATLKVRQHTEALGGSVPAVRLWRVLTATPWAP